MKENDHVEEVFGKGPTISDKIMIGLYNLADFYENNKEFVTFVCVPVILGAFGFGKAGLKAIARSRVKRTEEHTNGYRFYDPSLKCWLELNRLITNAERIVISKRRQNGERVYDILVDLGLI